MTMVKGFIDLSCGFKARWEESAGGSKGFASEMSLS